MSAESERIDLNSDVVFADADNEALNGQRKAAMAGSSVEKEANKVRVLDGEVLDREANGGKSEDLSSKVLESEDCNGKDETLFVIEAPLGSLEGEPEMESHNREEDLLGKDKDEGVSFGVEQEKVESSARGASSVANTSASLAAVELKAMESGESVRELKDGMEKGHCSDKGASSVENISSNLSDSSHVENLEATESKTMGSVESARDMKDDSQAAELEEKVEPDKSLDPGDSKVSTECGISPSDGLQNGVLEVHLDAETTETRVPKSSGDESNSFNIVVDLNTKSLASKSELGISDLVWAKVRSHPWWPGQVCDPKAASLKAKKYSKRDAYLIAYFGDNTFSWNEASRVKPFLENFSQMEKNSNTEDFHHAIACALDEVSRRVEFGLACSCLSEEVYAKVKTQLIVNTGIREELSKRDGGDRSLTVTSFEPIKLVRYIKELAQAPYDVAYDRLELALARSQLLAFYRFKGYSQLPEFNMLGGILENDADISLSTEKKHCDEAKVAADQEHKDDGGSLSEKEGKSKIQNSSLKRKLTSGNSTCPSKKEKSLSDLMAEKRMKTSTRENGSEGKASSKKRKASVATFDGTPVREMKSIAMGLDTKPVQNKLTFRVGDSIRRVASQLNGSSPILKNGNGMLKNSPALTKSKEKTISEKSEAGKLVEKEHSPDEMLSQLCLAAKDPMRVHDNSVFTFFSEFRDTVSFDLPSSEENEETSEDLYVGKTGKERTKNGRKSIMSGMNELPHQLGSTNESYWSERIVRSIPEDQNETGELGTSENEKSQTALHFDPEQKTAGEDLDTEAEKLAVDHSTGRSEEDPNPTALILNFTDFDSVPSETNLNKIFSSYGPLKESDTKVFKKSSRAKVVFKRRSDAETAFSSAGKYSTFGPSLVSYRLKYMSSTPSKASPNSKKRIKTERESAEDSAK